MNSSALKTAVCRYLAADPLPSEAVPDASIEDCLAELEGRDCFRAIHAVYKTPPSFLQKQPYTDFLRGAEGCILLACTLGIETDRRLRRLAATDLAEMLVYDACANAYLEARAEEWKSTLAASTSYLFCPGYGGSDLSDLVPLFAALKPERIGMELTPSGLMLPQKSLAGVVAIGVNPRPRCDSCIKQHNCAYQRKGTLCFQSEQN